MYFNEKLHGFVKMLFEKIIHKKCLGNMILHFCALSTNISSAKSLTLENWKN